MNYPTVQVVVTQQNGKADAQVFCPTGDVAVGGGVGGADLKEIIISTPIIDENTSLATGWFIKAGVGTGNQGDTFTATAVCVTSP